MAGVLQICLFGGLDLSRGTDPLTGFISSKVPALLAYLALTRHPHQRDALAALLWSETSDADARNNLRQALSNARKVAGDILLVNRDAVAFDPQVAHSVDVLTFEQLLQTSRDASPAIRAEHLQRAVALYRGDFLAGFVLRDAPDFDDWALAQRVRWREQAIYALHVLTEHHLARAEYGRAIDGATRLLALDAWREEAHRQLMTALAHSGQRAAALAQHETCSRVLARELGVAPSAATQALVSRIRAAGETARDNLPLQATSFVGRTAELARIHDRLLEPACRLLTLVGGGGMGKTRLALEAAAAAARRGQFLDGVFFVSLSDITTVTQLATAVAAACGCPLAGSRDPGAQLRAFLRGKELLLVADNFEHLLDSDAVSWLADVLQQAPAVQFLLTSRAPLNLRWEWTLPVDGLPIPADMTAADAASSAAVQLFAVRAQAADGAFALDTQTLPHVASISRLVAGMPLALELAAAQVRHYSCAEIAAAVGRNLDFLAATYRDMAPRHRSLRAVFDSAWSLLAPDEQALFAALAVFHGGFAEEAAVQVCGASRHRLAGLADRSLLTRLDAGRFQLHAVLRGYAAEHLAEARRQELLARHAAFYAGWLRDQGLHGDKTRQGDAWASLRREEGNLRAAWQWALATGHWAMAAGALPALRTYYNVQSRFQEGVIWLEETLAILEAAGGAEPRLLAQVVARLGSFYTFAGEVKRAAALLERALKLATALDDPAELGFVRLTLGTLTVHGSADYSLAETHFAASLAACRRAGDRHGEADALSALGALYNLTGKLDLARENLDQGVALARAIDDTHGLCAALTNLGNVHYMLGALPQAAAHYREVVELCRQMGDRYAEGIALSNLGAIASDEADYTAAARLLQEGIDLFAAIGAPQAVIQGTTMLCGVYRVTGRSDEALAELRQALGAALAAQLEHMVPYVVCELAQVMRVRDEADEALALFSWLLAQPATVAELRQEALAARDALVAALPASRVQMAQARAAALDPPRILDALAARGRAAGI